MYAVFVLQLVHHEYAFYRRKILHRAKHIEHKLLVVFHIGGVDFQQVVEAAADIVAFGHFRYALHNLGEFGGDVAVQLPHLDVAEHHKALVEFGGIEYGDVFWIYPRLSMRFNRSNTGVDDRLTCCASSLIVSRALPCSVRRICKSTLSNFPFFDRFHIV